MEVAGRSACGFHQINLPRSSARFPVPLFLCLRPSSVIHYASSIVEKELAREDKVLTVETMQGMRNVLTQRNMETQDT